MSTSGKYAGISCERCRVRPVAAKVDISGDKQLLCRACVMEISARARVVEHKNAPRDMSQQLAAQRRRSAAAATESGSQPAGAQVAADDDAALPLVFRIVRVATGEVRGGKKFTVYVIEFGAADGTRQTVGRRYSQFAQLHQELCEFFPKQEIPKLTSKRFRKMSRELIERRQRKLQDYLNAIALKAHLRFSDIFHRFLHDLPEAPLAADDDNEAGGGGENDTDARQPTALAGSMHEYDLLEGDESDEGNEVYMSNESWSSSQASSRRAATPVTTTSDGDDSEREVFSTLAPDDDLVNEKIAQVLRLQEGVAELRRSRVLPKDAMSSAGSTPPERQQEQQQQEQQQQQQQQQRPFVGKVDLSKLKRENSESNSRDEGGFSLESAVLMSPRQEIDVALERAASARGSVQRVRSNTAAMAAAVAAATVTQSDRRAVTVSTPTQAAARSYGRPREREGVVTIPVEADAAQLCSALVRGQSQALETWFAALPSDEARASKRGEMQRLLDSIRASHERHVLVAQRAVRAYFARKKLRWLRSAQRKRRELASELLRTELSYVQSLDILTNRYYAPLLATAGDKAAGLLSEQDLRVVLGNLHVDELLVLNSKLLNELNQRMARWTPHIVLADLLIAHLNGFRRPYARYFDMFDASDALMKKRLARNDKLREFCDSVKYEGSARRDIFSHLITPIQRLTRYALLIEGLVAATPEGHPDDRQLRDALVVARSIVMRINLHMQARQQLLRWAADVGARGPQPLCAPERFIAARHECKQAVFKDDNKTIVRWNESIYVVLSDYVLLFSNKAKHRAFIPLQSCWLRNIGPLAPDDKHLALSIEVLSATAPPKLVRFGSAELRDRAYANTIAATTELLDSRHSADATTAPERASIDALQLVYTKSRFAASQADVALYDGAIRSRAVYLNAQVDDEVAVLRGAPSVARRAPPVILSATSDGLRRGSSTGGAAGETTSSASTTNSGRFLRRKRNNTLTRPGSVHSSPQVSPRAQAVVSSPLAAGKNLQPLLPPASDGQSRMAVALFPYTTNKPADLQLKKGDIIENIDAQPSGWWRGCLRDNPTVFGAFPATYVKPINFALSPEVQAQVDEMQRQAQQQQAQLEAMEQQKSRPTATSNSGSFVPKSPFRTLRARSSSSTRSKLAGVTVNGPVVSNSPIMERKAATLNSAGRASPALPRKQTASDSTPPRRMKKTMTRTKSLVAILASPNQRNSPRSSPRNNRNGLVIDESDVVDSQALSAAMPAMPMGDDSSDEDELPPPPPPQDGE